MAAIKNFLRPGAAIPHDGPRLHTGNLWKMGGVLRKKKEARFFFITDQGDVGRVLSWADQENGEAKNSVVLDRALITVNKADDGDYCINLTADEGPNTKPYQFFAHSEEELVPWLVAMNAQIEGEWEEKMKLHVAGTRASKNLGAAIKFTCDRDMFATSTAVSGDDKKNLGELLQGRHAMAVAKAIFTVSKDQAGKDAILAALTRRQVNITLSGTNANFTLALNGGVLVLGIAARAVGEPYLNVETDLEKVLNLSVTRPGRAVGQYDSDGEDDLAKSYFLEDPTDMGAPPSWSGGQRKGKRPFQLSNDYKYTCMAVSPTVRMVAGIVTVSGMNGELYICMAGTKIFDNPCYEIALGQKGNSLSSIRRGKMGSGQPDESFVEGRQLTGQRDTFWFSCDAGFVSVGKGDQMHQNVIMTWRDNSPVNCNYVGLTGAFGQGGGAELTLLTEFAPLPRPNWRPPTLGSFEPDVDAEWVHKAIVGLGTNDGVLIEILTGRSNEQIQAIRESYRFLYNKEIQQDLAGDTSGNYRACLMALVQDPIEFDVEQLYKAMKGLGTTESVLIEVLGTRSNQEIVAIKNRYLETYQHTLEDDIAGDTGGDFKAILLSLCQADRNENNHDAVNNEQAASDARRIFQAGEGKLGTNEAEFIEIFTKRSMVHMVKVAEEYKKLSTKTLEQVILSETSGDLQDTLLCLSNPAKFTATLIRRAVKGMGTNDALLVRVLCRCDAGRLYEAKQWYFKDAKRPMMRDIETDTSGEYRKVLRRLLCTHQGAFYATMLREAMYGVGTDEHSVNRVLAVLCQDQHERAACAQAYLEDYGRSLERALKSELGSNHAKFLIRLTTPRSEVDAEACYKAMKGLGTDEDVLIEILTTRTNGEIKDIGRIYSQRYGRTLEEDIRGDTSGYFKKALLQLIKGERSEKRTMTEADAAAVANQIFTAGEARLGTDDTQFVEIFTRYSPAELQLIDAAYLTARAHGVEYAIKAETSGDYKAALMALVYPNKYVAKLLYQSMHGLGTSDKKLIRLIAHRTKEELREIAIIFSDAYDESLEGYIRDDTSGYYKQALLGYLTGPFGEYAEDAQYNFPTDATKFGAPPPYTGTKSGQLLFRPNWTPETIGPFNAESDAQQYFNSMKGLGTNDQQLIDLLTGRTPPQVQLARAAFEGQHPGEKLIDYIKGDCSFNYKSVLVALCKSPVEFDAWQLNQAIKGLGTTDSVLIEVLTTRTNNMIEAIKEQYMTMYGRELVDDIKNDTSGHYRDLLVGLCEGRRNEGEIDKERAANDARQLYRAVERGRMHFDQDTVINVFTQSSWQQLMQVAIEFRKISLETLEFMLKKLASGDFRRALLAMLNPPKYAAYLIHKAVKNLGTDDDLLIRLLVRMDPPRLYQAKKEYMREYKHTMMNDVESDVSGDFKKVLRRLMCSHQAAYHAVLLREAMSGVGTDDLAIQRILLELCTDFQMRERACQAYAEEFGKPLEKAMRGEVKLWGNVTKFYRALCTPRAEYDAAQLYGTMLEVVSGFVGVVTTETLVIDILTTRTNAEIHAISQAYSRKYGRFLEDAFKVSTHFNFGKMVSNLLKASRSEATSLPAADATTIAQELYKAGEGKMGTDDQVFVDIMTARSAAELQAVDRAYQELRNGRTLEQAITKETSGDYREMLLACVNPDRFVAKCLYKAMKGIGTNDSALVRVVSFRTKDDFRRIAQQFEIEYKKTLVSFIKGDTSGAYQRALLNWMGLPDQ